MTESAGASVKAAEFGLKVKTAVTTVKPGPTIVKFWQGIVDVVLRGVVVAVGFLVFIVGAVFGSLGGSIGAAGGWMAFVAFLIIVFDVIAIIGRFINFAFVHEYPMIVMLVDVIAHGVAALLTLPGFIATAVYTGYSLIGAFGRNTGITLVLFSLVFMGVLVGMAVYSFLWFFLKWFKILKNQYEGRSSSEGKEGGGEAPPEYDY